MTRVHVTFWTLFMVAVGATGVLSRAVAAPAKPATGLAIAASGLVLAATGGFALRILVVLTHGRQR